MRNILLDTLLLNFENKFKGCIQKVVDEHKTVIVKASDTLIKDLSNSLQAFKWTAINHHEATQQELTNTKLISTITLDELSVGETTDLLSASELDLVLGLELAEVAKTVKVNNIETEVIEYFIYFDSTNSPNIELAITRAHELQKELAQSCGVKYQIAALPIPAFGSILSPYATISELDINGKPKANMTPPWEVV
ncbi:hypothetical protein [Shewanella sp. MBTL60-007]|uniref:hypothetical protein n=1 Tax=Shewanella sp. MBTL60-007 TaxID=2815911 RepID=UPI001BBE9DCD|nr:hypothetical protein [Shewanella sp. MBTL60-007]GIU17447.1 hypothetical protein TUM3792_12310 [Shewanella sp. MBTL60-007]